MDSVGDFCELALSSRLHLLFLAEEVLGFNCSFMLVCHIAPVVFKLFALVLVFDVVLSVNFLSPDDSLSTSFLLLLRFNLLSKLHLLSCDILRIMLSYLLDCFVCLQTVSTCSHTIRFHKSKLTLLPFIITHSSLNSSIMFS